MVGLHHHAQVVPRSNVGLAVALQFCFCEALDVGEKQRLRKLIAWLFRDQFTIARGVRTCNVGDSCCLSSDLASLYLIALRSVHELLREGMCQMRARMSPPVLA